MQNFNTIEEHVLDNIHDKKITYNITKIVTTNKPDKVLVEFFEIAPVNGFEDEHYYGATHSEIHDYHDVNIAIELGNYYVNQQQIHNKNKLIKTPLLTAKDCQQSAGTIIHQYRKDCLNPIIFDYIIPRN